MARSREMTEVGTPPRSETPEPEVAENKGALLTVVQRCLRSIRLETLVSVHG